MATDRRTFLGLAGAAGVAALLPGVATAGTTGTPRRYVSSRRDQLTGAYSAAVVDVEGRVLRSVPLPDRGHSLAVRPGGREVVAMARRPDTFAVAFEVEGDRPPVEFSAPKGRHFCGHAVFSADGRRLLATENDHEAGHGVVGIYDASDGYRRLGEVPTAGIGPHQLLRAPTGDALVVANGGILTAAHSREKLNLDTMAPSLTYLSAADGRVRQSARLPADRHHLLSIRHIDVAYDGTVAFGCQDQGPPEDALPLVGRHRPGEPAPVLFDTPESVRRAMQGYVGSVTLDPAGEIVGASSPRGGVMAFWQLADGRFLGTLDLADGCGLAPGAAPGRFVASSGRGRMVDYDARSGTAREIELEPMERMSQWDHHMLVVPG
jgi:uncharacterized protein